MRKLFLLALVIVANVAMAQLQKGKFLIGGAIGFLDLNTKNHNSPATDNLTESFHVTISPRVGLFLTDRSVVGLEPGYSYRKEEYSYGNTPTSSSKRSMFTITPFYRHYFLIGEKVAFYLHGSAGVSFGKDDQHYLYIDENTGLVITSRQKSDFASQQVSMQPGFAFFINTRWSVETSISSLEYTHIKNKLASGEYSSNSDRFGFDYNVFSFGVTAYLGRD